MSNRRILFSSTFWIPLLASLSILLICFGLYEREADQIRKGVLDREERRTEIFSRFFAGDIHSVIKDLQQLADGDGLRAYLTTGQKADLDRAIHRAGFFSRQNPDYDQVRYIDEKGMEVVRINWNGEVVPSSELQDRADRTYFQKASLLAEGQFYISALDLNIENGQVEQPFKPTIRVAMPIFDATGKHRGIYLINYLAANSIERLRLFTPQYQQRLRVLSPGGYWILGQKPGDEWGFVLPERSGMTLAKTDPALWAQISSQKSGQTPYNGGYFSWCRVVPSEIRPSPASSVVAEDDYLIMASQISETEWDAYFSGLQATFLIIACFLLLLLAISWRFFHARQQAQKELDRFFNTTRDMVFIAGFDGYFKRVNPAAVEALGYTTEELFSRPFVEFVHPDDRNRTVEETGNLIRGGETILFENRYLTKGGNYKWLSWTARPLSQQQTIFATARDLTERKEMEEKLKQSEQRNRSIIESAYDAFISIGPEGCVRDWNLQAETIFGWPREEAMGRPLHETIIPERYRAEHVRGMKHLTATGEGPVLNRCIELFAIRRNGEEFPVELSIWPLKLGTETVFNAFVRDITRRKQADERIQNLSEGLKKRAEQLEAANKELEAFSYSVSHDLRAPLRHIHGFIELLQTSPTIEADAENRRYMEIITRAAGEMGLLIDDLLAFSRTGRVEMHPVKIDVQAMVKQVVQEMEPEAKGRNVVWDIKPLPKVHGDTNLLRSVWVNLISNALKYTRPRDEATIEIGHTPGEKDGREEHIFHIKDNGVGFDMAYASKLFGVFQRLHRAADFEGTGIGLANVQRIIHRHGGRVWAESSVNKGATFYFSLPANIQSGADDILI